MKDTNFDTNTPSKKTAAGSGRKALVSLSLTALFAALTAAGTFLTIPVGPVPISLQSFFAVLSGLILGPALGPAAVGLFLAAGALGAPVFANNGQAMGIVRFLSPTGGYLWGYLLAAAAAGLIAGFPKPGKKIPVWRLVLAALAATVTVYIPGLIQLKFILGSSWGKTLAVGLLPFIPGDILKAAAAVLIAPRLRRTAGNLLSR
jgi:biotin transport system substrate-specific component